MKNYNLDPWYFVEAGDYEQAIKEYTRIYREENHLTSIRNRGIVYLLMRDYTSALTDFNQVLSLEEPRFFTDRDFIFKGVCHWVLHQPDQAINIWQKSMNNPYSDAAGGVKVPALLLYSGVRLGDAELRKDSWQLLMRKWKNHQRRIKRRDTNDLLFSSDFVYEGLSGWPGVIVPFLLGKVGQEEIETIFEKVQNKLLEERWRCQGNFYIGLKALLEGDKDIFRTGMLLSFNSKSGHLEHEYYLARWEFEGGFADQPFINLRS